jgi:hypothetical protein
VQPRENADEKISAARQNQAQRLTLLQSASKNADSPWVSGLVRDGTFLGSSAQAALIVAR